MWDRRDLLQDELYGKPKGKGDRPYVPTVLKLFGLARDDRDTRDEYAQLPDELLGVSATARGLLLARVLFGLTALLLLSLILPLRQIAFDVVNGLAGVLGDPSRHATGWGIAAQWVATFGGLAVWIGATPELHSRFVEAPSFGMLFRRFALIAGIASIVWLLGAVVLR